MGPLQGIKVVELSAIGPSPMACMLLADMGADVIVIDRNSDENPARMQDISFRGKRSLALNLKTDEGIETLLRLIETADVLTEGFRPGVAERLGVGPDVCLARNPKLVYARMTGWGQEGPLAQAAGHDINYIALTGALHAIGRQGETPVPPLNLVGDMGGGGMLLVQGILAALLQVQRSGEGQVIDAAMTDGSALLMWMMHSFQASGFWNAEERGVNVLDGATHFYDSYETADGKYVAIGAIEPQFYNELLDRLGVDKTRFAAQMDAKAWPEMKGQLASVFKSKTRDEWCKVFEGSDACFAPVLSMTEAPNHPHNQSRNTYVMLNGQMQPAPAPRFSATPSELRHGPHAAGQDNEEVLRECGFDGEAIESLRAQGVVL